MIQRIIPFLLFEGQAEKALNFYVSIFPDSKVSIIEYHKKGQNPNNRTSIFRASFSLCGQEFMCGDTLEQHDFTFTPSLSMFISIASVSELESVFAALSENGKTHKPIGNYGFSKCYAWVQDKFGVSWQLNVPNSVSNTDDSNVCFANSKEVRQDYRE